MKRFAIILLAAVALVGGIGVASAQMHGGGFHGGGSHGGGFHGGGFHGGGFHGGGFHGSRVFVGVGFGAPWFGWGWWPGYYPAYYPYYPYYGGYYPAYPSYAADYPYGIEYSYDDMAPSYVQKDAPAYDQQSSGQRGQYQYYCPDPAGYYPQVATCAQGWLRVVPPGAPGPAAPGRR